METTKSARQTDNTREVHRDLLAMFLLQFQLFIRLVCLVGQTLSLEHLELRLRLPSSCESLNPTSKILELTRLDFQAVTDDVWWYYMISMAFYWSLAFSQFADHKRKDFWQMFIHHVLTLLLIALSWVCNIHRVGSLILLVHDCADVFLEAAKSLNYAKLQRSCDVVFGIFTIAWIVTRLMMFPRIIYACVFQTLLPSYPVYYFFNCMLISLLILHFIWTYMIFQVIAQSVKSGEIEGDVRSSSEDEISDGQNKNN